MFFHILVHVSLRFWRAASHHQTLPGASAPRTRGGAKRSRVAAIAPAPPAVGEREGLRARNQRRSYPYPSDDGEIESSVHLVDGSPTDSDLMIYSWMFEGRF